MVKRTLLSLSSLLCMMLAVAQSWHEQHAIPWHTVGDYCGPAFCDVSEPLEHTLSCREDGDCLLMELSVKNPTEKHIDIKEGMASVRLGINTSMEDPKVYINQFFPTMLRCEKTHLWGYFEAPDGRVLAICSPDAVASWHNEYAELGHRIHTVTLDLMHPLPLPKRHPQTLHKLAPHQQLTWRVWLIPLSSVSEVPETVAKKCGIPIIDIDRTTLANGETAELTVYSPQATPTLKISSPTGAVDLKQLNKNDDGRYTMEWTAPPETGYYIFTIQAGEKLSEATIFVRRPWSWYLQQAEREASLMEQKAMQHREGWMGFFTEYWAQVYFPDTVRLAAIELDFQRFYKEMIDPRTGFFYTNKKTWHTRPQNTSWMLSLLTARYAATHNEADLLLASHWADMLIRKFQLPNGAYKGYTALTLGAKFMEDLAWYEQSLAATDPKWKERYDRHRQSSLAAARNICEVGDLGDTEGEATYEDSQAGSAWSMLAVHALMEGNQTYLERSLEIQQRHECLTQALVPDARMRGGSLRFWEAQYDVLIPHNMMNSPHGWTMRSQFGALYLYLLTGREYFLNVAYNSMGSCIQTINHQTGELRWGFVPDPYIKTERFVPDPQNPTQGIYQPDVLGEEWLPVISKWWRVPDSVSVAPYRTAGWSCDNDVHEHFRIMAEQYVQNAFVLERPDGTLRSWNCCVERKNKKIIIRCNDYLTVRVHLNLRFPHRVELKMNGRTNVLQSKAGMQWVGHDSNNRRVPAYYVKESQGQGKLISIP